MPELRYDPLLGQWALIVPARRARPRPHAHPPSTPAAPDPECPFCQGREEETPPEVDALREEGSGPDSPGWWVRVIPNKYPAVAPGPLSERAEDDLFRAMAASGRHEVLIDSPHHCRGLADLPDAHAAGVLTVLQRRVRKLYEAPSIRAVAAFKNHGPPAGASVRHSHLQVLGLPFLPPVAAQRRERAEGFFRERGQPLLNQVIARELEEKRRAIETGEEGAVVFCPYASRFPYQTLISPWPPEGCFAEAPSGTLAAVGGALARTLRRLKSRLADPPLNVIWHSETGPPEGSSRAHPWHIEVIPRLVPMAGLEIGSGAHINEVAPEEAAEELRRAQARLEAPGP